MTDSGNSSQNQGEDLDSNPEKVDVPTAAYLYERRYQNRWNKLVSASDPREDDRDNIKNVYELVRREAAEQKVQQASNAAFRAGRESKEQDVLELVDQRIEQKKSERKASKYNREAVEKMFDELRKELRQEVEQDE